MQMDLYGLLGITSDASEREIKKAYRQKALTCHPDKNPDNPRAAELFHQLSQALEVLTDGAARAAYDKLRKAKEAAAKRTQKLDDKRKKNTSPYPHLHNMWAKLSSNPKSRNRQG
uniref:DnaJ homolog subfamily C member 17 n=1 Tax=Pyxicephalus adspersus TaxID=30357 RepID=A0AAV2ZVH1_PYXAD|nr:TPA: hypothetical protein GDO54_005150 [Pyxicephalus adspersus]